MSNNVFYQSDILRIYPYGLPSTSGELLETAQSIQVSNSYQRQNVQRLGKFGLNKYRPAAQAPSVIMNVDYIPTGMNIFRAMGLMGDASICDNLISGPYKFTNVNLQQRNIYGSQAQTTFSFSSGVLTNFDYNIAVGETPTARFSYEFLSYAQDTSTPVVQPNYVERFPIITSKDIQISSLTGIIGIREFHLQSFSISVPFQRNYQYRIGEVYPFSREANAPIVAQVQIQGLAGMYNDLASGYNVQTQRQLRGDYLNEDITVTLYRPTISGEDIASIGSIVVGKPYVDDISWGSQVGSNTNVSINMVVPITFEHGTDFPNIKFLP